jgi:hypothetical protein
MPSVRFLRAFYLVFLCKRTHQKELSRFWRAVCQTMQFHARISLIKVLMLQRLLEGFVFTKALNKWAANREFKLKQSHELLFSGSYYFCISSIAAACRKKLKIWPETQKSIQGHFPQNILQWWLPVSFTITSRMQLCFSWQYHHESSTCQQSIALNDNKHCDALY